MTVLASILVEQIIQLQGLLGRKWNWGKLGTLCREGQPGWTTMHSAFVQDCLQSIGNFLWTHYSIASTLICTSLALTVATSSFLALPLSCPVLPLPR